MPRALVAISGGVDSAVAALLMQQDGYRCEGVTMLLHDGQAGLAEAASASADLGISHRVIDLRQQFAQQVIAPFAASYACGETPNPCIDCNRAIKFGALLDYAIAQGFDCLATGHYARVTRDQATGTYRLCQANDLEKDQSYMLYQLSQAQLPMLAFPLGGLTKDQVRKLAREAGLTAADKPESQDICFVAEGGYHGFVRSYLEAGTAPGPGGTAEAEAARGLMPGEIVDQSGRVLGSHQGISGYTIGQRRGLGIAAGSPLYVTQIDAAANRLTVGPESGLYHTKALLREVKPAGLAGQPVTGVVEAKFRYRSPAAPARLVMLDDGSFEAWFDQPVKALTPGQALVCYQSGQVVAGGIIASVRD